MYVDDIHGDMIFHKSVCSFESSPSTWSLPTYYYYSAIYNWTTHEFVSMVPIFSSLFFPCPIEFEKYQSIATKVVLIYKYTYVAYK